MRFSSSWKTRSLRSISVTMSSLRSASTLLTLRELLSSVWISSSRAATVCDSREMPSKLAWMSGPAASIVSETTFNASCSWAVSIRSVVVVRSPNTPTMSYADWVRSTGITSSSASCPDPAGVRSRYFSPSRFSTSIEAWLSLPNSTPWSTSNVTSTLLVSSWTSLTRPTRIPATCTMLPVCSPLASLNSAW